MGATVRVCAVCVGGRGGRWEDEQKCSDLPETQGAEGSKFHR